MGVCARLVGLRRGGLCRAFRLGGCRASPRGLRRALRLGGCRGSTGVLALAAFEFGAEGVEALVPEAAVAVEPHVHLPQRRGVGRVEPPGAIGTDGGETVLAQHAQMLRHPRL